MTRLPWDALPDLGDRQVIVHTAWDRSPDLIDAQVTGPIVSALLGAPEVKSVRGLSDYGSSNVYAIFEDGTDLYWARSRVLEALSSAAPRLPEGATTSLGPDATSVGWIFQYALVDESGAHGLQALRSLQDWTLKDALRSVPGVAEVATVGGFVRQFQVNVDPNRLRAHGLSIQHVASALRGGNRDAGGRIVESGSGAIVYVPSGDGAFSPRSVQTGWRFAGRVQILSGLTAGESIVIAGNALLDSESRMRRGDAGVHD
jgi:Cu(I)/Ag(I) efflux system membrane protein CusA/SilA